MYLQCRSRCVIVFYRLPAVLVYVSIPREHELGYIVSKYSRESFGLQYVAPRPYNMEVTCLTSMKPTEC